MKQETLHQLIGSHMAAGDPATHITDYELIRSRERTRVQFAVATNEGTDGASAKGTRDQLNVVRISAKRARRARTWLLSAAAAAVLVALVGGDLVGFAGWRGSATAEAEARPVPADQEHQRLVNGDRGPGRFLVSMAGYRKDGHVHPGRPHGGMGVAAVRTNSHSLLRCQNTGLRSR